MSTPVRLDPFSIDSGSDVGKWVIGQKTVTLVEEKNTLVYYISETSGSGSKRRALDVNLVQLYGVRRAKRLIKVFHTVVEANLKDQVSSRAFLPLVHKDGLVLRKGKEDFCLERIGVLVVLFGLSVFRGYRKEIVLRWGIFRSLNKPVEIYVDNDKLGMTRQFVESFPFKSLANTKETEKKETTYGNYVDKFKPIIVFNGTGKVKSISLKCLSRYDASVELTKTQWAATALSVKTSLLNNSSFKGVGCPSSHAMIAFEGFISGHPFIRYAHITTKDEKNSEQDKKRKSNEARVEIYTPSPKRKGPHPSRTTKGPTWIRSRCIVEKLMQFIKFEQDNYRYVKFSQFRDLTDSFVHTAIYPESKPNGSFSLLLRAIFGIDHSLTSAIEESRVPEGFGYWSFLLPVIRRDIIERNIRTSRYCTCGTWVREILRRIRIDIRVPGIHITPQNMIDYLNSGGLEGNRDPEEFISSLQPAAASIGANSYEEDLVLEIEVLEQKVIDDPSRTTISFQEVESYIRRVQCSDLPDEQKQFLLGKAEHLMSGFASSSSSSSTVI